MRVISLVPSLTETLISCGVEVVGRTRFCVHPAAAVAGIPRVGGTKGVDWQRCEQLKPDLVIFDREENLRAMADECPFPWLATHIRSVDDMASELQTLADALQSQKLAEHAAQWRNISSRPGLKAVEWSQIPGQLEPLRHGNYPYSRIEYIIWRDPWMAVGPNTFITSMLTRLGFAGQLPNHTQSYPQLDDEAMRRDDTFYLFSSEPYRFLRYHNELLEQGFHGAIVDGEVFSWFGIRSFKALTHYLSNS